MTQLDGAVVLVVGATGALGSRIAARVRSAGAIVVGTARRGAPGLVVADLRDDNSGLVPHIVATHGRLDGVVVAAGVVAFGPTTELSDAALHELAEVNAFGPIRLIRDALPALTESAAQGREPFVLTLSGIVSESPTAGMAAYSASKAALASFAAACGREMRRSGIRIVDARPGHTETGLATRAIEGVAPAFAVGLDPDAVADRIVRAIVDGEKDLPSAAFA
jgi:cyclic-di-GMP-binding biofilm dispersal mediator protein